MSGWENVIRDGRIVHKHAFKIKCGTRRKIRFVCSICGATRHYDRNEIRHRLGVYTWTQ